MASSHVVVQVLDGLSVIDGPIRRPVRLTPDGYAGVVYAGAVYPLLRDNVVDISGPSWEIEDCNRFLLAGAEVPYAPNPRSGSPAPEFTGFEGEWYVDSSALGHYVLFNASERVAGSVVDALEGAGLSVQRWDASHRPATDGRFYDWFARLRFTGSHDECESLVGAVFSATPIEPPAGIELVPAALSLEQMQAQVEQLLEHVVQLQTKLSAANRSTEDLRARLERATFRETRLTTDLAHARTHQRGLREQIEGLRQSASLAPRPASCCTSKPSPRSY